MNTNIEMAREADLKASLSEPYRIDPETGAWLERFAELVRADEREACAKVVLEMKGQCWAYDHDTIAAAIRARGNT